MRADAAAVTDSGALLAQWRELVGGELALLWAQPPASLVPLAEAVEYSLLAPGKRVRPLLVLAAADACGVDAPHAVGVAVAFELVHCYSLVHDDLPCMDDDDLRRGMPTSHRRFGEGVAVLVGDALQAEAFARIATAPGLDAAARIAVVGLLAQAAGWRGMVGGQFLDIAADPAGRSDAALRELHDRKTGALIAASVEAGAVVAGVDVDVREAFAAFGRELGWLFQLVDDLLDEVGETGRTGKATGSDRRQGKVTATAVLGGVDGVRAAADEQLERCLALCRQLPRGGGVLADIARYVRERDH